MTARAATYLKARLKDNQPDVLDATTALARWGRDLIDSIPPVTASVTNYNFPAESPAVISGGLVDPNRRLAAGLTATVRFATVPDGINGSDTAHYLYINDGASSEAVLITGGTASASIRTNGTITFIPANNHAGAWTISSASGGIAEAMVANPTVLSQAPAGVISLYAPVTAIGTWPGLIGQGTNQTFLYIQYSNDSVFKLTIAGSYVFRSMSIVSASGIDMTAGAAIDASTGLSLYVSDIFFGAGGLTGMYIAIRCLGGSTRIWARDLWMQANFRGFHLEQVFFSISNVQCINGRTSGTFIANSTPLYLKTIAGSFISDFINDAGAFAYSVIVDTSGGAAVNEISIAGFYSDRCYVHGLIVLTGGTAASWEITNMRLLDPSNSGASMMQLTAPVLNWQVSNSNIGFSGRGIDIIGASDVTFTGVRVSPIALSAGGVCAVGIQNVGTPKNIRFVGCEIGTDGESAGVFASIGFINAKSALDGLTVVGCDLRAVSQAARLQLVGNETSIKISDNNGISSVRKTVAAAATLTFPVMDDQDVIEITGSTALATGVAGLREGQQGVMVWTDAAPGLVSQTATVASPAFTPTRYQPYKFMFSNAKLYVG